MKKLFVYALLFTTTLWSCQDPEEVLNMEESLRAQTPKTKNYKAEITGSFSVHDPTEPCGPGFTQFIASQATGNMTHLGKITIEASNCNLPAISQDPLTFQGVNGQITITAANGDQLFGAYTLVTTVFDGPEQFTSGEIEVTGGTGKLSGAEGTLSLDLVTIFPNFTGTLNGSITTNKNEAS